MTDRPRILILDDQADEFDGLKLLLEDEGYDVTMTSSPFSLPFVIRAERPDLVLVDLNMPVLSGEALLTRIPRSSFMTKAPIVLFSGVVPHDLTQMVRKVGADGCIYKGSDISLVLAQIKFFIGKRSGKDEVRR